MNWADCITESVEERTSVQARSEFSLMKSEAVGSSRMCGTAGFPSGVGPGMPLCFLGGEFSPVAALGVPVTVVQDHLST